MPVLGERLGELHTQSVHLQVVAVGVLGEQLVCVLGDRAAHGDQVQRQDVHLAVLHRQLAGSPEVGEAQVPVAALAREVQPVPLGPVGLAAPPGSPGRRPRPRPGSSRRRRRRGRARPRWPAGRASSAAADGPRSPPAPRTTDRSRPWPRAGPTGPGRGRVRRPSPRSRPPRRPSPRECPRTAGSGSGCRSGRPTAWAAGPRPQPRRPCAALATRTLRWWRALRSALAASSAASSSGAVPRRRAMVASISRRPSKASRA